MSIAVNLSMPELRNGGVYTTPDNVTVVVCSEAGGGYVLYVLEESDAPAEKEAGERRRKFELFKADAKGRLFRFGRPTDWRIADLEITDTGQTARLC